MRVTPDIRQSDHPEIAAIAYLKSDQGRDNKWNAFELLAAAYGSEEVQALLAAQDSAKQVRMKLNGLLDATKARRGAADSFKQDLKDLKTVLEANIAFWTEENIGSALKVSEFAGNHRDVLGPLKEFNELKTQGNDRAAAFLIVHAFYKSNENSTGQELPLEQLSLYQPMHFAQMLNKAYDGLVSGTPTAESVRELKASIAQAKRDHPEIFGNFGGELAKELDEAEKISREFKQATKFIKSHGSAGVAWLSAQQEQGSSPQHLIESILGAVFFDARDPQNLRLRDSKAEIGSLPFGIFRALGLEGVIEIEALHKLVEGKNDPGYVGNYRHDLQEARKLLEEALAAKLKDVEGLEANVTVSLTEEDRRKIHQLKAFGKIAMGGLSSDEAFERYLGTEVNTLEKRLAPMITFLIRGSLERFSLFQGGGTDEERANLKNLVQEFRSYRSYVKMFGIDQHSDYMNEAVVQSKVANAVDFFDDTLSKDYVTKVLLNRLTKSDAALGAMSDAWGRQGRGDLGSMLKEDLRRQVRIIEKLEQNEGVTDEAIYELIRSKVDSASQIMRDKVKRSVYLDREKVAEIVNETEFLKRKCLEEKGRIKALRDKYTAEFPQTFLGKGLKRLGIPYDNPQKAVRWQYGMLAAARMVNLSYNPHALAVVAASTFYFGASSVAIAGFPAFVVIGGVAAFGYALSSRGWNFNEFSNSQAAAIQTIVFNGYNAYTSVKMKTEAFGDKTIIEISDSAYEAQLMIMQDLANVGISDKSRPDKPHLLGLSYIDRLTFEVIRMRRKILFEDPLLNRESETEPKSIEAIMNERGVEYYRLKALLYGIKYKEDPAKSKSKELYGFGRTEIGKIANYKAHGDALSEDDPGYGALIEEDENIAKLLKSDVFNSNVKLNAQLGLQGVEGTILDEDGKALGYTTDELKDILESSRIGVAIESYQNDMLKEHYAWYEGGDLNAPPETSAAGKVLYAIGGRAFGLGHFRKMNTSRLLAGAEKGSRDFKARMILLPTEVNGRIWRLRNTKNYKVSVAEEKALDREARTQVAELGHDPVKKSDGSQLPSWAEMFTIKQMPVINAIVADQKRK